MPAETLAEVCSLIVDCPHNTAPTANEPFAYAVGTTAISSDGRIDLDKARGVSEETYTKWVMRATPRKGDLIFCREAPVGPVAMVPDEPRICLGQRTMLLRPDATRVDAGWLAAFLRTPTNLAALMSRSEGSTVAHINVSDVRRFEIVLPPLDEQHAIASVLKALDHKIESNRRLGEGLADTTLVMSAQASTRAGSTVSLASLAVQVKVPGQATQPYLGLDRMPQGSTILDSWNDQAGPAGASWAFEPGDLLYGKLRPYFRKVGVAPISGRCTREIVVLRPIQERHYGLLVGTVASQPFIDYCTAVSSGTKMPRAEWKSAAAYEVGCPAPAELESLTSIARANFGMVAGLIHESRTLTALRDALLPKLVSGQIRVPLSDDPEEGLGAATGQHERDEVDG